MRRKKIPNFNKMFKDGPFAAKYFIKAFCGKRIGTGLHRKVYIFKPDDRYVVKIERSMKGKQFINVNEWSNWEWVKEWVVFSKWLAPCEWISENGQILIQRRIQRIVDGGSDKFPKKIPSLLTDTKYFNFGWLDGRLVCCDYPFFVGGDYKLKNAKWWGNKK